MKILKKFDRIVIILIIVIFVYLLIIFFHSMSYKNNEVQSETYITDYVELKCHLDNSSNTIKCLDSLHDVRLTINLNNTKELN